MSKEQQICCGNCKNFLYEDINGCGYCEVFEIKVYCDEECAELGMKNQLKQKREIL